MKSLEIFILLRVLGCIAAFPLTDENNENIVLNEPSEIGGRILETWLKDGMIGNPEEQGPYFEGDLIMTEGRNGVTSTEQLWTKAIVPFQIAGSFTQSQKNTLSEAIENFTKSSCIKFIPRAAETDYLVFENSPTGCWSTVGKNGGRQVVNLQKECFSQMGTIAHELLHALGFYHEQNRSDRDKYVRIINANIPVDKMINFEKNDKDETFGIKYDYGSVLHYSPTAFSMNGRNTIESKGGAATKDQMGQRAGLSTSDIKKLNKMYCK